MNETRPASDSSTRTPVTSGHLVQGLRAKYYDIGNLPLGVPFVTLPHIHLISLQPGQSLLDIGCGTGEVLYHLHKHFGKAVSLYGIDPSGDMLEVARYKLRKATNVIMEMGMGEQLRFPEASFDWVVSSLTFHHLPLEVKRATIRESYRVLQPGGKLLISDFGKPTNFVGRVVMSIWANHAFTPENIREVIQQLLREQGFMDISESVNGGVIHHILAQK